MEALTPLQRIVAIAIGLTLTVAIAVLILPWISQQIQDRLGPDLTPSPAADTPQPTSPPAALPTTTVTPRVTTGASG